jgi:catechol 2,3-dioxygenase
MSTSTHLENTPAASIDPATALGPVRLTVSDLDRSRAFYERAVGLRATELDDGTIGLGVPAGRPLVELRGDSAAPRLNRRAPGLYHLAILLPTRLDLAFALARLVQSQWPLDGASDHLVSEALYLSDPDGNGIEIYRDRPRSQWPTDARGSIRMATLPLDLDDVLAELGADDHGDAPVAAGTRMGHVHLQVGQLDAAERFYCGVLGFEPTARGYPGALFASAGGYHHHIGLNTWQSLGAPPLAPGGVGLRSFEVLLPSTAALDRVLARVSAAGSACEPCDVAAGAMLVRDPFGIAIVLRSA